MAQKTNVVKKTKKKTSPKKKATKKKVEKPALALSRGMQEILTLLKARTSLIYVVTCEEKRFLKELAGVLENEQFRLWLWSLYQGLVEYDYDKNKHEEIPRASADMDQTWKPNLALDKIRDMAPPDKGKGKGKDKKHLGDVYILRDFHTVLRDPLTRQLRDLIGTLEVNKKSLIITAPELGYSAASSSGLPLVLDKDIVVVEYDLPSKEDIKLHVEDRVKDMQDLEKKGQFEDKKVKIKYTKDDIAEIVKSCQGLSMPEIHNAIPASLVKNHRIDPVELLKMKEQHIKKSQILEFVSAQVSVGDVGGLDQAKEYFQTYKSSFSDDAKEFGVEPPTGILLVGVPGCGKSLFAKSICTEWKLPGIRLDVGKVMGSLVGQSIRGSEEIVWFDKLGKGHRNTISELVKLSPKDCYVPTYDDNGVAKLGKVEGFIPHKLKDNKLFRLVLDNGRSIVTTGDHGVLTHNNDLTMREVRVDSLQRGDFLAMPGSIAPIQPIGNKLGWHEGFLAGAWLGDGDYNAKDVRYHLHPNDIASFSEVLDEMPEKLDYSVYNASGERNSKVLHVRGLQNKLKELGFRGNSHTKRIPAHAYGQGLEFIKGLLSGYFSTDGSFTNHVLEASSVSKQLRDDIAHLLHYVGIHAYIAEKTRTTNFSSKEGTIYIVKISGEADLRKFESQVGFVQDYKAEKLADYTASYPHGYYMPFTEELLTEMRASRREMWKQLHSRPYNTSIHRETIGLATLKRYTSFREGPTMKRALEQDVRWIKVTRVEQVPLEDGEDTVYDISVPGLGIEKFIAGSCPLLVHNSEQRMREAIKSAEAMAPAVLWLDEIEKAMSGVKSSGISDAGTMSRVFGTFLVWMQEKTADVIVIATANDISQIPPEMIRRFNEVFFVDMPVFEERKEIFKIHLAKRKRDPSKFDLDLLAEKTQNYTGAEIEKACQHGIANAFYLGRPDVTDSLILKAVHDTKPIYTVMGEKIHAIREWARGRARYASHAAELAALPGKQKIAMKSGKSIDIDEDLELGDITGGDKDSGSGRMGDLAL